MTAAGVSFGLSVTALVIVGALFLHGLVFGDAEKPKHNVARVQWTGWALVAALLIAAAWFEASTR